jgi:hypothetical protein
MKSIFNNGLKLERTVSYKEIDIMKKSVSISWASDMKLEMYLSLYAE